MPTTQHQVSHSPLSGRKPASDTDSQPPQPGLFIVFEGLDGAGKTTQISLLKTTLEHQGYTVVSLKEPTDGPADPLPSGASGIRPRRWSRHPRSPLPPTRSRPGWSSAWIVRGSSCSIGACWDALRRARRSNWLTVICGTGETQEPTIRPRRYRIGRLRLL